MLFFGGNYWTGPKAIPGGGETEAREEFSLRRRSFCTGGPTARSHLVNLVRGLGSLRNQFPFPLCDQCEDANREAVHVRAITTDEIDSGVRFRFCGEIVPTGIGTRNPRDGVNGVMPIRMPISERNPRLTGDRGWRSERVRGGLPQAMIGEGVARTTL